MNIDSNLLYGIYDLVSTQSFENGVQTATRATSGMFVFRRDQRLSVVSGATDWVMAYTGSFKVEGDILQIQVDSCVVKELEGTQIIRKIEKLDGQTLVLSMEKKNEGKRTVIEWKKVAPI